MKVSIQVANRDEANMVLAGLADPEVFALVRIVGALSALQPRAQGRVLRSAEDKVADERAAPGPAAGLSAVASAMAEQGNGGEPRLPGTG